MKNVFEYNRSYMSKEEKKRFVRAVIKSNFESACWHPSIGMQSYRDAQSIIMKNGKWTKLVCYDTGVHVSSLRSPGWGLSTGNAETSTRLRRWWKWLRNKDAPSRDPLQYYPKLPESIKT